MAKKQSGASKKSGAQSQQLDALAEAMQGQEFASEEEMAEFLTGLMFSDHATGPAMPTTEQEQAMELLEMAEHASEKDRAGIAQRALAAWPDFAEAYLVLAASTETEADAIPYYEQAMAAVERTLGKEAMEEYAGNYWLVTETRPYMQARRYLAEALWEIGEREAAIAHAEAMLHLNPNDNQGNRYLLINGLLALGEHERAARVIAQYQKEPSAQIAYALLVCAFRQHGPGAKAKKALSHALEINPYVPAYILGASPLPKEMPDSFTLGSREEALLYVLDSVDVWVQDNDEESDEDEDDGDLVHWVGQEVIARAGDAFARENARKREAPRRR